MHHKLKLSLLTVLTLGVAIGPSLAANFDPRGVWQTTSGESRYRFEFCGDGSQLCATLVWLNEAAMKSPAAKQLGTYAFEGGKRRASNAWRGTLHYDGKSTQATVTLRSAENLDIAGCYYIFCRKFDLVKLAK
jgi:uncharacterized protein (DUF2147 family)